MYKELIISAIIVISIFVLDFITQKYTDDVINEAIQDLTTIKQALREDNVNEEKVIRDAGENYEKWLDYHKTLAFYIEHNELEKVETNLTALKSYSDTNEFSNSISELDKSIFLLNHIQDKYAFNLQNIF